ncbi:MAG: hypothetical protein JW749_01010 [Sedimentisphaerales bacterium]|nr:hypothetical protein [Sedimentisphaerales bacterium]
MNLTLNDLTIDTKEIDFELLLEDWRWLIGNDVFPLLVSALGDIFLSRPNGHVFWLDTSCGTFTEVAETIEKFKKMTL